MWIIKSPAGYAVRWYDAEGKRHQKNFKTRAEAKRHGAVLELTPQKTASTVTVRILMEKYIETVTPTKRGQREETLRIRRMERDAFADKTLSQITTKDIQGYLTERSKERTARSGSGFVSPSTVTKERITLSAIFSWAVKQGFMDTNPVHGTDTPPKTDARTRVASDEEVEMILAAAGWDGTSMPATKVQLVAAAFVFACRTGMRSGEILQLEESWIDGRVIHLPKEATKTGAKRDVALSSDALRVLELVKERGDRPQIF